MDLTAEVTWRNEKYLLKLSLHEIHYWRCCFIQVYACVIDSQLTYPIMCAWSHNHWAKIKTEKWNFRPSCIYLQKYDCLANCQVIPVKVCMLINVWFVETVWGGESIYLHQKLRRRKVVGIETATLETKRHICRRLPVFVTKHACQEWLMDLTTK